MNCRHQSRIPHFSQLVLPDRLGHHLTNRLRVLQLSTLKSIFLSITSVLPVASTYSLCTILRLSDNPRCRSVSVDRSPSDHSSSGVITHSLPLLHFPPGRVNSTAYARNGFPSRSSRNRPELHGVFDKNHRLRQHLAFVSCWYFEPHALRWRLVEANIPQHSA